MGGFHTTKYRGTSSSLTYVDKAKGFSRDCWLVHHHLIPYVVGAHSGKDIKSLVKSVLKIQSSR